MPSATYAGPPSIPKWKRPGHTTEKLDWADIQVIDLSTFDEPGGKQQLAEELRDAVSQAFRDNRPLAKLWAGAPHWLLQHNRHWFHARRSRSAV
jgi:hypothetical protein